MKSADPWREGPADSEVAPPARKKGRVAHVGQLVEQLNLSSTTDSTTTSRAQLEVPGGSHPSLGSGDRRRHSRRRRSNSKKEATRMSGPEIDPSVLGGWTRPVSRECGEKRMRRSMGGVEVEKLSMGSSTSSSSEALSLRRSVGGDRSGSESSASLTGSDSDTSFTAREGQPAGTWRGASRVVPARGRPGGDAAAAAQVEVDLLSAVLRDANAQVDACNVVKPKRTRRKRTITTGGRGLEDHDVEMAEGQGVRARAADADDRPLLPGEKKKLRREAIKAKRAARAARQGFDLAGVKEEFESMVADGTEMRTLGPMGRDEMTAVKQMSAIYGLKLVTTGNGACKGAVVYLQRGSGMPTGAGVQQLERLLRLQTAREDVGQRGGGTTAERQELARMAGIPGISTPRGVRGHGRPMVPAGIGDAG